MGIEVANAHETRAGRIALARSAVGGSVPNMSMLVPIVILFFVVLFVALAFVLAVPAATMPS